MDTCQSADPGLQPEGQPLPRYYGKYQGTVVSNEDPMGLGRLSVVCPAIDAHIPLPRWARPCVPYAGPEVGFFFMPPIGASIWVEFEGGNPHYPIWSGCFWDEGETPLGGRDPMLKVLRTKFVTLIMNDTPEAGGFTLQCMDPAVNVPILIKGSSEGVLIQVEPATVNISPEAGISLTFPPDTLALTEATIEISVAETSVTITGEGIEVEAPEVNTTANSTYDGPVEVTEELAVGGAAQVGDDLAVGLATEIGMELAVGLATEVGADLTVAGETDGANADFAAVEAGVII